MKVVWQTTKSHFYLLLSLLTSTRPQLSSEGSCSKEALQRKWTDLCLPTEQLETLLSLGHFSSQIHWMEFFALGCSALAGVGSCISSHTDTNTTLHHFPLSIDTYCEAKDSCIPPSSINFFCSSHSHMFALESGYFDPLASASGSLGLKVND